MPRVACILATTVLSMPSVQEPAQTASTWPASFVDAPAPADIRWTNSVVEAESHLARGTAAADPSVRRSAIREFRAGRVCEV
jgi:hypothetical protein